MEQTDEATALITKRESTIESHSLARLTWSNVNVFSKSKRKNFYREKVPPKQILHDVSGVATSNNMLALMGASGAGKTTFLNVLSDNSSKSFKVTGQIRLNNNAVDMRMVSCYVEQFDMFHGRLTVTEHLKFHVELQLGDKYNKEAKEARLKELIIELNLAKCENNIIGVPGRYKGISGGERKRLNVATEIIKSPKIIYLDEPTSGLDTHMAESVVKSIKNLSNNGHIVICTIHQPSSQIFAYFDSVYLLAAGKLIYTGSLSDAYTFFFESGFPCPEKYNPADHYITVLSISAGHRNEADVARVMAIRDRFLERSSQNSEQNQNENENENGEGVKKRFVYRSSIYLQFTALMARVTKITLREPYLFGLKIGQAIFIGLLIGLVYLRLKYTTSNIQSFTGVLFFVLTNVSFSNFFQTINLFPSELVLYYKEHKKMLYRSSVYFTARTMYDAPVGFLVVVALSTIIYWMVNLYPHFEEFMLHILTLFLVGQCAISYSYIISAIAKNTEVAMIIGTPLLLPLMLFGGFLINSEAIPVYFIWLEYLSWYKYGFEALMILQFKKSTYVCDSSFNCKSNQTDSAGQAYINGTIVLEQFSLEQDNLVLDLILILVLTVIYRFLAYLIILLKTYRNEH